jgi:SAM-dependent methyltransferase
MGQSTLREYVDDLQGVGKRGLPRGFTAKVVRRVTTHNMREGAKLRGTKLVRPWSRRKAAGIAQSRKPLLLHLGCGLNRLDGWANVDIIGMNAEVFWDLRDGVPFPDNSAVGVFCEHVLEHFALADGIPLLDECFRVLKPGGIVRFGVPDFGKYLVSYAGDRHELETLRPGRPTPMLALAEVVLAHGHRSAWDGETLTAVLRDAGFVDVVVKAWGQTDLPMCPDTESRKPESVYAEGRKPSA